MTWVLILIAYTCLLAVFLLLVGGVRRADALRDAGARNLTDGDVGTRVSAPPRPSRAAGRFRRRRAVR